MDKLINIFKIQNSLNHITNIALYNSFSYKVFIFDDLDNRQNIYDRNLLNFFVQSIQNGTNQNTRISYFFDTIYLEKKSDVFLDCLDFETYIVARNNVFDNFKTKYKTKLSLILNYFKHVISTVESSGRLTTHDFILNGHPDFTKLKIKFYNYEDIKEIIFNTYNYIALNK